MYIVMNMLDVTQICVVVIDLLMLGAVSGRIETLDVWLISTRRFLNLS